MPPRTSRDRASCAITSRPRQGSFFFFKQKTAYDIPGGEGNSRLLILRYSWEVVHAGVGDVEPVFFRLPCRRGPNAARRQGAQGTTRLSDAAALRHRFGNRRGRAALLRNSARAFRG